jgi:hypothetical protein
VTAPVAARARACREARRQATAPHSSGGLAIGLALLSACIIAGAALGGPKKSAQAKEAVGGGLPLALAAPRYRCS